MSSKNPLNIIADEVIIRKQHMAYKNLWQRLHLDPALLCGLLLLSTLGLIILYSAGNQDPNMLFRQITRLSFAYAVLFFLAQIPPSRYRVWAPRLYILGISLLLVVLLIGHSGNGAQRWLSLGFMRFQPSEILKLAVPLMLAWFLDRKYLPPNNKTLFQCALIIFIPALLIAKQPDLGTALVIIGAGLSVILLAGISWRLICWISLAGMISAPIFWHMLHNYQRQRVLTFLNPERDPLGSGYHIIQSKIAIGSGGILGKGWLNGTQSHLNFLPEHSTDFIFALFSEELGLIGAAILLILYLFVVLRGLYIANQCQDTFSRLLAGSISFIFFISAFINMGMVTGILPVVGVPLPLISYGGTSMVTLLAGFGILMSIQTHRRLMRV